MIIPSKHSGYQAGIRLYPGGGGDGSGGQGDPTGNADPDSNPSTQADSAGSFGGGRGGLFGNNAGGLFGPVNTGGLSGYTGPGRGGFDGGGYGVGYGGDSGGGGGGGGGTTVKPRPTTGTSIIAPDNPTLKAMQATGQPYDKLGGYYNSFLQQGYSDSAIRNALQSQGQRGGPSQPVSDSDYELLVQNAGMTSPTGRPFAGSGQFTQPVYNSQYQNYTNPLTTFNVSNYGTNPGMSRSMQAATAPGAGGAGAYYQHLQGYGNLLGTQGDRNNINTLMNDMRQYGISAQDLQSASSYTPPQQQYNPFSYQQPQSMGYADPYSGRATGLANPTNYANQRFQQQQQYNPYQQQQQQYNPFGYQQQQYNPYQQQQYSPFSYQQQYNPYDSYPQTYQQQPVVPTSSGPTSPIVGRSSGFRGTPNVMRRAEGGIAGILKK